MHTTLEVGVNGHVHVPRCRNSELAHDCVGVIRNANGFGVDAARSSLKDSGGGGQLRRFLSSTN